ELAEDAGGASGDGLRRGARPERVAGRARSGVIGIPDLVTRSPRSSAASTYGRTSSAVTSRWQSATRWRGERDRVSRNRRRGRQVRRLVPLARCDDCAPPRRNGLAGAGVPHGRVLLSVERHAWICESIRCFGTSHRSGRPDAELRRIMRESGHFSHPTVRPSSRSLVATSQQSWLAYRVTGASVTEIEAVIAPGRADRDRWRLARTSPATT
ncbi:MAG: hypothetical protein QOI02_288, partial [Actinomycetota bacterium]|nr:hypothetical protein [Actinomycetota bacterium]